MDEKQELVQNIPMEPPTLVQKEKSLDAQFSELDLGFSNFQNDLLKLLNENTSFNGVKMIQFNAPTPLSMTTPISRSTSLFLKGPFSRILKVVHALENQGGFGAISYMGFEKKRDFGTKQSSFQSTVHLELME